MSHPDHGSGDCDSSFSEEGEEEKGSCCSTVFYSTRAGGSYDEFRFELEEIEVCGKEDRENDEMAFKDCRICHMGLDESPGVAIELGCSCKDDLAVAHKGCADHWFTIKGNKTCEICNSVARNVTMQNEQLQEEGNEVAIAIPSSTAAASDTRRCWQGHRFLNFMLGCMVFAFVVSWLFHFNVSS